MNAHLGDRAVGVADAHKRRDTEEEVRGCVQPAVQSDKKYYQRGPQHSHQIHGQEQDEEGDLGLPEAGQPQKNELTHPCLVFPAHGPLKTTPKL